MITFRTHCSGGELFGVGARQAGFAHIDGFEIDPKIAAVARLNGFDVQATDVCDVDYASLVPVDHAHTSPSCKRASRANTNQGETADDLAVADSVVRMIHAHQGRTFSLENVIEYRWFESFDRICQALTACGFLFRVVAKGGERPAWRDSVPIWNDAGEFVDAADFGVPQNRKRLILRAARGVARLPGLRPTHSKRGGILLEPWNGWYGAIADLIDDLPATTPAKWQLARMPAELRETLLIGANGFDGTVVQARPDQPSFTITANGNHAQIRAFLMAGARSPSGDHLITRSDDEPATTVVSADGGRIVTRAFIIGGGNTGWEKVSSQARPAHEPMFTVRAGSHSPERAFLLQSQNTSQEWGKGYREGSEPSPTVIAVSRPSHQPRAYAGGRWVRMTIHPLGRFQTVPDSYVGLTPEINGNGVPSLLARRIVESLRGVYES